MSKYTREELLQILNDEFMSTKEAVEYLGINRVNFSNAVKRNKIPQIEKEGVKLYLRQDIEKRKQESEELNQKFRPYDEK